jgi:hypothetical protein
MNPNPWLDYQPKREREKEFYDIELRDGTIVPSCYPNGIHWNPWTRGNPDAKYRKPIADYRVVKIRLTHPSPFDQ